jgi:pimeloyl-ACP methyl ester carboxylesterase
MDVKVMVTSKPQNLVFVHGSCHGGWCWKKILPYFDSNEFNIYSPTLTGLGERSHLANETTDLYTHIEDILQVFKYEDLFDVILVGHSYAGMVISGVAEMIPDKIKLLIYLDAYIPQDGKTAFDLVPGLLDLYKGRIMQDQDKPWLVRSYTPVEFGLSDKKDIEWVEPKLVPMPWHTHTQPLVVHNKQTMKIPKAFITSAEFEGMFQRQNEEEKCKWDCYELKRGHYVMITAPEELSRIILNIVSKEK